MGAYCPQGSASPQLCQAGYYLNSTGNAAVSDCVQCSPGHYCSGGGNDQPVGQCDAGWYCPGGQADPHPTGLNCTLGMLDACRCTVHVSAENILVACSKFLLINQLGMLLINVQQ